MLDQSPRFQLEGDDERNRTLSLGSRHECATESNRSRGGATAPRLSGRYSSAVHSGPEPSGSAGLIARHITRKAPNESVARMTTVLMRVILLTFPGSVIV